MNRYAVILVAVACLMLACADMTVWESLANPNGGWELQLYRITDARETIAWLVHSAAIASVVSLAFWWSRRKENWVSGFSRIAPFYITAMIGALVFIPTFNSALATYLFPDVNDGTFMSNWEVWFKPSGVVAHFVVAIIAAAIGVSFRRTGEGTAAKPITLASVVNWIATFARSLWPRRREDGDTSLKTAPAPTKA